MTEGSGGGKLMAESVGAEPWPVGVLAGAEPGGNREYRTRSLGGAKGVGPAQH